MSKGARKTGGRLRRTRAEDVVERRRSLRPPRKTILIVGAGRETEPNYFRALAREDVVQAKFAVTVKKGPGQSPLHVVQWTADLRERESEYDEAWCVLDVENVHERSTLEKALDLAQKRGVQICLSNPCFEVWFLARFERSARSYEGFKGVKLALNKYWKEPFGHVYDKTDEAIYRRIHKQTETAICNAKWAREKHHGKKARTADCNSSTEVYVLVEELLGR